MIALGHASSFVYFLASKLHNNSEILLLYSFILIIYFANEFYDNALWGHGAQWMLVYNTFYENESNERWDEYLEHPLRPHYIEFFFSIYLIFIHGIMLLVSVLFAIGAFLTFFTWLNSLDHTWDDELFLNKIRLNIFFHEAILDSIFSHSLVNSLDTFVLSSRRIFNSPL